MSIPAQWYTSVVLCRQETPDGTVDGDNVTFTLAYIPVPDSVSLYANGVLQVPGTAYTLDESVITFAEAPSEGVVLWATYLG